MQSQKSAKEKKMTSRSVSIVTDRERFHKSRQPFYKSIPFPKNKKVRLRGNVINLRQLIFLLEAIHFDG